MRRVLAIVVLAIGAFGCGGGSGGPDGPPIDAGIDAPPGCVSWTLEERTITALEVLDPTHVNNRRPLRLAITVELGACEELAMGSAGVVFETPDVVLTTRAWVPHGGTCTGAARAVTRPIVLSLRSAETWTIRAAGVDPVTVDVAAFPDGDCDASRVPCAADCDCDAGERCLGYDSGGIVGPTTTCARPCEVDRDCDGTACEADPATGAPWTCVTAPECGDAVPCPTGWTCDAGACAPDFTLSQSTRATCACDADCAPGLRCVQPYDTTQPSRCQATCETGGAWCQGAHVCGSIGQDLSGLAGTDSVCGWLGE